VAIVAWGEAFEHLLDARNGERFDLPRWEGPRRCYVIASLPRTGSTMLCRLLEVTGRVGAPKEYLNPMQTRDWGTRIARSAFMRWFYWALRGRAVGLAGQGRWTQAELEAWLEAIRERRTGADGWFGLKLHHHHFRQWFLDRGWEPQRFLGAERWVVITRRDKVAQAVSWARAMQTGRWSAEQQGWVRPVYSRALVERYLARIRDGEQGWASWMAERGIVPHRVVFEDLVHDPEGTVRDVLRFLGVRDAGSVEVPPPPTRAQLDPESEQWRLAFLGSLEE